MRKRKYYLVICWILGDSNIKENEIADKVAKDIISNPLARSVNSTPNETRRYTYYL